MTQITRGTRPTFVRLDDDHHEILQGIAEAEGTTISALLRRAAIQVFSLPTGREKTAQLHEERAPDTTVSTVSGVISTNSERSADADVSLGDEIG